MITVMGATGNTGKKISERRTPENTTPTRFEEFAGELVQAYKAM